MARITRLELLNFRSHPRSGLDLDGRPVALFGANGAGKTNVLEAVSLLSPGRGLRRAQADEIARRPDPVGWKIRATLAGTPDNEVETWAEPGGTRQVRINGKTAPQAALGQLARVVWLVPAMDRLWIEGAEGRRRFLDRMTLSFTPAHAESTLGYEKAMRQRNRLLKDDIHDPRWYAALEEEMARYGATIDSARREALARVTAAQEGAETAFPAATLALTAPEPLPQGPEALAQALHDSRPRDRAAGRTLIGPHRADLTAIWAAKGTPAAQCSTGEQKALLISLILANARALAGETPPLLLLDEVAAHLDEHRRAALYDEICALGAQAFMTGTDAGLFSALRDRAQHIEVTETTGASTLTLDSPSAAR